jgi:enamine deaminase RidA (YjgF/YER057c/UK114 family)
MDIRRIEQKRTYSDAVIYNGTVYLSGIGPWSTCGEALEGQEAEVFKSQVWEVLLDVKFQLERANSSKDRILSLQIFLRDPEMYSLFNSIFVEWLDTSPAPARNVICGINFQEPGCQLQVACIAAQNPI